MEGTITWLHLSDLHACTPLFAWDAERVTDTLLDDLRQLHEKEGLNPDLLFFTGDAAFGEIGTEDEETICGQLARFGDFLHRVREVFSPEIPLEHVFLVPGNHDVHRGWVTPDQTDWLDRQTSLDAVRALIQGGGLQWRRYMERLRDYREFLRGQGLDHLLTDPERLIYAATREIGGLKVGVGGFNSAWSCCRDGERGRLWMAGLWQQGVLYPELREADFSIALVHHPPSWLVESETPDFEHRLEQDYRFVLHGHEHKAWVQEDVRGHAVIAAAACYERSDTERNGYSLVRLDVGKGRGEVWLRRYEADGGGFIPRILARGQSDGRGICTLRLPWLAELGRGRKKAPAAPISDVGDEAEVEPEAEWTPPLRRYLQRLRTAHRDLPIFGFETRVRLPIRIDEVYIPLRARVRHSVTEMEHPELGTARELQRFEERERDVAFDEALRLARENDLPGVVVLGDPGSGKTTLLKHYVLAATDPRSGPESLGLERATIPVLIELRRLKNPAHGLREAIERAVSLCDIALEGEEARGFMRQLLRRDRLLLLIDGLDEVADAGARAAVSRWLEEAALRLPRSTFVVSSRYAGYKGDARLSGRFLELHIREVEEPAARRFLRDWYQAVESQARLRRDPEVAEKVAAEGSDDLAAKIFTPEEPRTSSLARLAANPLMLQILCLVHRDRKQLPERRVELYRECVLVLLELWRRAKGMPVEMDAQQALRLLQPLAYHLHADERREAPAEEILPHLAGPLRELRRDAGEGARLLEKIRDQSGVLVSLGRSEYGFLHLGFQEYLAARHIQDRFAEDRQILRRLAERFGEPWWREVILLSLGLANPSLFDPLMASLLELGVLPRDAALADDCLRDALVVSPRPFLEALEKGIAEAPGRYHALRLLRAVYDGEGRELVERLAREDPEATVRSMAAELLGLAHREEDATVRGVASSELLEGVQTIESPAVVSSLTPGKATVLLSGERVNEKDGSILVLVPEGEYTLGAEDLGAKEKPVHRVRLSAFWIGKYPVTNEQYGRYLEALPGRRKPDYWDDKEFNQPQQPVVGVGWREALAYCRWAELDLPSEAQWEAAARGTDQRLYPWGDEEPNARLANFGRAEGRTTPVGAYSAGAGPFGTLDQAGNVWEWCWDEFQAEAYQERAGVKDPVASGNENAKDAWRVLRGGSWALPSRSLRASIRSWIGAGIRDRLVGFRVCCRFRPEP